MILDKNDREERLVKKAMRGNVDAYGKVVDISISKPRFMEVP